MTHEIIIFLAGIVVGAMNAVAGGGLLVGFPALMAVGLTPLAANVTGHMVVIPGGISATYGYRKYLRKLPRKYLYLLIPNVAGAAIGAMLLKNTSSERFEEIIPLLIFFAVGLFALQPYIHFHLHRHISKQLQSITPLVMIGLAFIPLSIYGGYFGAGYGFIMLAFLGFTKLHEAHQLNGFKNLSGLCIGITSFLFFVNSGLISWKYGLIMAAGGALGSYYGATLTTKLSSHTLRLAIVAIGVSTAAFMAYKTYLV